MPSNKKRTEQIAKRAEQRFKNNLINTLNNALDLTAEVLYKEVSLKVFDKCIDQFYMYETKRYYRHDTGKGSGTGMNLYRANNCQIIYREDGHVSRIHVGWNANDMAPYKMWKDKDGNLHPVSAEYVLNNVMNGIRGLEDEYMSKSFATYNNHWSANINSDIFGSLSGTPNEIFDEIDSMWQSVTRQLFRKHFNMLYRKTRK